VAHALKIFAVASLWAKKSGQSAEQQLGQIQIAA